VGRKQWIGADVGWSATDAAVVAGHEPVEGRVEPEVVEVRLEVDVERDWSAYDECMSCLAAADRRALIVVSPFRGTDSGANPEATLELLSSFFQRFAGSMCSEGILLDPIRENGTVVPDMSMVTSWLDTLDRELAGQKRYVCIDTNLSIDIFSRLLELLRDSSSAGALPYIVRRAEKEYADTFAYTRYFTAAARLQRTPFVLAATAEPAMPSSAVSAVFEALSSGATGLVLSGSHFADAQTAAALAKAATHLNGGESVPRVAVLWPSITEMADRSTAVRFITLATTLRDITDYDILDETRVSEDTLAAYEVLLLIAGCSYGKSTLEKIYRWVCDGGVFLANCVGEVRSPDGETTFNRNLLDRWSAARNPTACCTMRRIDKGAAFHYSPEIAAEQGVSAAPADGFLRMVASVLRRNVLLGTDRIEPDGLIDGVHVARLHDRILLFNATDRTVTREILLPRTTRTCTISLPPLEITESSIAEITAAAAEQS